MTKINVAIIFGGKSAEHEVSLRSAKNVIDALDKEKFNPILIGINKSGKWFLQDIQNYLENPEDPKLVKLNYSEKEIGILPNFSSEIFELQNPEKSFKIDVAFPVMHGTFCEDGTIQGFLKLANIPFVGPSVLGSALGMDKDFTKRILRDAQIKIGKFLVFSKWENIPNYEEIAKTLGEVFFVKPANAGSSVGVNKIKNSSDFEKFTKEAFKYDNKILFEEFTKGREIEVAILGNENPIASIPGEIIPTHEFYSYEAKYIDENGATTEIPAKLKPEISKEIQEIAIKSFKALGCEGLSRVDFFVTENDEIYFNEINTIPGFTKISMYPKMFEVSGIPYKELITKLLELAIERGKRENEILTNFEEL